MIQRTLNEHPGVLPMQVAGDKGYSYSRIRRFLEEQGIDAVIPDVLTNVRPTARRTLTARPTDAEAWSSAVSVG